MTETTSGGKATVTEPSETEILIACEFEAPPELVFEAWTTPELIKRWWAGKRGEVTSVEVDLRVGGAWRYVMNVGEGGFEIAFHGEYREIVAARRLVNTEVFEGMPDGSGSGETLNITTFAESDGGTALELLVQAPDRETRDAIIASGMEGGMQEQMELLERVAVSLR